MTRTKNVLEERFHAMATGKTLYRSHSIGDEGNKLKKRVKEHPIIIFGLSHVLANGTKQEASNIRPKECIEPTKSREQEMHKDCCSYVWEQKLTSQKRYSQGFPVAEPLRQCAS